MLEETIKEAHWGRLKEMTQIAQSGIHERTAPGNSVGTREL
jgi:hypothetical protein